MGNGGALVGSHLSHTNPVKVKFQLSSCPGGERLTVLFSVMHYAGKGNIFNANFIHMHKKYQYYQLIIKSIASFAMIDKSYAKLLA
jgi:hypothetical protein